MIPRFLLRREIGSDSPSVLTRAECTRRVFSIELSDIKEIGGNHHGGINGLDLDLAVGRYLLSAGQDRAIGIHDTLLRSSNIDIHSRHKCPVVHKIKDAHTFAIETVQWYPHDNGIFTSSGMDGTVKLWDASSMVEALVFDKFSEGVVFHHAMSPTASHNLIAVGSTSNQVSLCDPATGLSTHKLIGHRDSVLAVAWSPNNEYMLASASKDNTIKAWDIRSAGPLLTFDQYNGEQQGGTSRIRTSHNGYVNGIRFTYDGTNIISTGTDSRVRVWDAHSGRNELINFTGTKNNIKRNMTFCVSRLSSQPLIFHPCGSEIAVYNLSTGMLQKKLRGHYGTVFTCIYHPVLEEFYSGGQDAEVLVWGPRLDWINRPDNLNFGQSHALVAVGAQDAWSDED